MSSTLNYLPALAEATLRGYAMGLAVKAGSTSNDPDVLAADRLSHDVYNDLKALFAGTATLMPLVKELDGILARHPEIAPLSEYFFDLAMLKIILDGTEKSGDDFLDSNEMLDMEDKTIDRGTELLNLLVYLRDCRGHDLEPSLSDFLNEFLLIEDEDFQDEFFIYEDVIRHQAVATEDIETIVATGKTVETEEMKDIFTPLMAFFHARELKGDETLIGLLRNSDQPALHAALYCLLMRFYLMEGVTA